MSNKSRPICSICKKKLRTLSCREHGYQRVKSYQCLNCYSFHDVSGELLIPISVLIEHNAESLGRDIHERYIQSIKKCHKIDAGEHNAERRER
jgi:hypothetical protein